MPRVPVNRLAEQRGIAKREIRLVRAVAVRNVAGKEIREEARARAATGEGEEGKRRAAHTFFQEAIARSTTASASFCCNWSDCVMRD